MLRGKRYRSHKLNMCTCSVSRSIVNVFLLGTTCSWVSFQCQDQSKNLWGNVQSQHSKQFLQGNNGLQGKQCTVRSNQCLTQSTFRARKDLILTPSQCRQGNIAQRDKECN